MALTQIFIICYYKTGTTNDEEEAEAGGALMCALLFALSQVTSGSELRFVNRKGPRHQGRLRLRKEGSEGEGREMKENDGSTY
jgi:hypothetical protein